MERDGFELYVATWPDNDSSANCYPAEDVAAWEAPCACHDCMDTTVSSCAEFVGLCELCAEAGCSNYHDRPGFLAGWAECQRPDAYGNDDYDPEES